MERSRRWVPLLLVLAGVILLAGVCVRQCEASAKNYADGKEIFSQGEKEADRQVEEDLSFLDKEEAEEKRLREESLKKIEEEETEEAEEDDNDDDDNDDDDDNEADDNEGEDFEGDTPLDDGFGDGGDDEEEEEEEELKEVEEKDVVILSRANFTEVISSNHYVMVEFYAPWCGHCQALAPEYAEAATVLKGTAVLAKIDATVEDELAQKFDVEGYPTLIFFIDGVHKLYNGQRQKDDIVAWVNKKTGPAVITLNAKDDAEIIVDTQKTTMAIAYFDDLKGVEAETYAASARQDDDVVFYQTDKKEVAEEFNFSADAKLPSLVLLKQEAEKVSWFDGSFERDELVRFVAENKLPLVITFKKETSALIFESPIKSQFLLFADQDEFERVLPDLKVVSKAFAGKMVFVHVDLGDTEQAPGITEFFGIPSDKPAVMAFESQQENGRKFLMEGDISVENMKKFAEGFLNEQLLPHLKSAPIPETNDEPVKIVVGKNLDEIVLDESTDCFLEIYAPWCGHCQALEPTWTKLAKRLASVKSIVIAKMDGTTNEHARAKPDGYPTLLFFPAGKKSFDPVTYDGDRTLKEFVKFLKREAAIPFTVPKRPTTAIPEDVTATVEATEPVTIVMDAAEPRRDDGEAAGIEVGSILLSTTEPEIIQESVGEPEIIQKSEPEIIQQYVGDSDITGSETLGPEIIQESVGDSDITGSETCGSKSTEESVTESSCSSIPEKMPSRVNDAPKLIKDEL